MHQALDDHIDLSILIDCSVGCRAIIVSGAIFRVSRATTSCGIGVGTGIHRGNATARIRIVYVADKTGTTETQPLRLATAGHSDREESKK